MVFLFQMGFCDLLGFLFVSYCVRQRSDEKKPEEKFQTEYQWSYINFTWPSIMEYHDAIIASKYIPENNVMAGIKFYNDSMYVTLPRLRSGTPVTLAHMRTTDLKNNVLLQPYPSWKMNTLNRCSAFQNVQGIEIDKYGIMWVVDGVRTSVLKCPPKIVLIDLNDDAKILQTHVFPNDVTLHHGGYLKHLVVDDADGGFAYITDHSMQDPGIVVYSRHFNRSWKIRDSSMFAELDASEFAVDDLTNENLMPVDGIALAPKPRLRDHHRMVYYCALNGFSLHGISTNVLKDEQLCKSGKWRKDVKMVGRKNSQSDGITMDNKGNLYYGMLSNHGVGKWNIKKPFHTARKIETNKDVLVWSDSFTFDSNGFLYVLVNGINKYLMSNQRLKLSTDVKFRILKMNTGTKSYLYS